MALRGGSRGKIMQNIHGLPREVRVVLLLCLFCLLPVAAMAGQTGQGKNEGRETVLEIIKLHKRPAGEILAAARSALSPAGGASVDVVSNAIILSCTAVQPKAEPIAPTGTIAGIPVLNPHFFVGSWQ